MIPIYKQLVIFFIMSQSIPLAKLEEFEDFLNYYKPRLAAKEIPSEANECRKQLIDWMSTVNRKLKLSDHTFYLEVEVFDAFCEAVDFKVDASSLHLLSITSMVISTKYEGPKYIGMDVAMKNIGHNKFTRQQIQESELMVLKVLHLKLRNSYIEEFAHHLVNVLYDQKYHKALKNDILSLNMKIIKDYNVYRRHDERTLFFTLSYMVFNARNKEVKFNKKLFSKIIAAVGIKQEDIESLARNLSGYFKKERADN